MFVVKLVYQRASDTDDDEVVDRLNKCRDVNLQENHVDVDSGMFKLSTRIIISLPSYNVQHTLQRRPLLNTCLLYTSPSPRDGLLSRMPSSA